MSILRIDNIIITGSADETIRFWNIDKDYKEEKVLQAE